MMSTTTKAFIENVRELFLHEFEDNRELYHENDIKRIKESDWSIERYFSLNEEQTLYALKTAMQWRKSYGVHEFTDQYFPFEIYKISEVLQYGADKQGRAIVWLVNKNHNFCPQLNSLQNQFLVYQMEKLDRNTSHQGWVIVSDATDYELTNYDLSYTEFVKELLQNYYPQCVKYMAVVDMPRMFSSAYNLMVGSMNQELRERVKFISKEELTDIIDPEFIPKHLGGNYAMFVNQVPKGVKRLDQITCLGFSSEQLDNINKTFSKLQENGFKF